MAINIHLFSDSTNYRDTLVQVVELLVKSKISINITNGGIVDTSKEIQPESLVTREKYWEICDRFRDLKKVPETDLVLLITPNNEERNYFSYFNGKSKNIFVVGANWDKYTEAEKQFPIAHQIIENILQCLSGFDDSKYAHKKSIGCLNDQCYRKEDIILKLRCADICSECIDQFIKGGVSNSLIFQSLKFLQDIRSGFLLQNSFTKNIHPLIISTNRVKKKLQIKVDQAIIKFTKTELFIFYIVFKSAGTGFNFNNPDRNIINIISTEFEYLRYPHIDKYLGEDKMKNLLKYISQINEKLVNTLGAQLASYYTIGKNERGSDLPYMINIFKRVNFQNFVHVNIEH